MAKIQYSLNSMRAYVGRTSTLTFQNMEISISNGKSRCKFCLVGIMLGVPTILAYVNNVSPSCVYFIIISRLRKQTSAESEHSNQNQNQNRWSPLHCYHFFSCNFSCNPHTHFPRRCCSTRREKFQKMCGKVDNGNIQKSMTIVGPRQPLLSLLLHFVDIR